MPTTPHRNRLNLYMDFTTPSRPSTPSPNPRATFLSPQNIPHYSASRRSSHYSSMIKAPSSSSGTTQYSSSDDEADHEQTRKRYTWLRVKRSLTGRVFVVWILLFSLFTWYCFRGRSNLDTIKTGVGEFTFKSVLFQDAATKGLQFIPAAHPRIHYMGRWSSTPNHLRMDGAFSGIYFDLSVANTTTVLLSLRNAQVATPPTEAVSTTNTQPPRARRSVNPTHVAFRPSSELDQPAAPISLIARVDQEEYVLFPNARGLVSVRSDLEANRAHEIRIIAPMIDDDGTGLVQLQGIWLSKHGRLERVEGSWSDASTQDANSDAENIEIGKDHRLGLTAIAESSGHGASLEKGGQESALNGSAVEKTRRRLLEVITDSPGSLNGRDKGKHAKGAHSLLAGVLGWDYLLGEMFEADHVSVALDGMCLIQECIGGVGSPAGIGDVFFRSGSPLTPYFELPWYFHTYIPDVMILNLGLSDHLSFVTNASDYNQTTAQLSRTFENTYISLVQGIRRLAYPKHPSQAYLSRSGRSAYLANTTPASIPIFIMRPFQGQLEHATQSVVHRLRAAGDKAVFWIDTSGWLQADFDPGAATQDFFLDSAVDPPRWRLTEQANQRVAVFLHMHVCRYLAKDGERCAFLAPEVYEGVGQDPGAEALDKFMEEEKGRRLRETFFGA